MSARRFNSMMLSQNFSTILVGKAGHDTTVNLTFINQNLMPTEVSLVYVKGTDMVKFTPSDYLLYNSTIASNGKLEIKGIVVEENTLLAAKTRDMNDTISVIAYGFEERF